LGVSKLDNATNRP